MNGRGSSDLQRLLQSDLSEQICKLFNKRNLSRRFAKVPQRKLKALNIARHQFSLFAQSRDVTSGLDVEIFAMLHAEPIRFAGAADRVRLPDVFRLELQSPRSTQ